MPKAILDKRKGEIDDPTARYIEKAGKLILAQPTIGDVCASCNNGVLSILDAYASALYTETFSNFIQKGESVTFKYDHDLLLRWLLKVSYNSARVSNQADAQSLSDFKKYIIGLEPRPGQIYLYLLPVTEYKIQENELEKITDPKVRQTGVIPPVAVRLTALMLPGPFKTRTPIRMIAINSYYFFLVYSPKSEKYYGDLQRLRKKLEAERKGITLLKPQQRSVYLPPANYDIIDMMHNTMNWHKISKAITQHYDSRTD